jgi:phage terminase small subunit
MKEPTARQARFIDEYLIDLNGTQAAVRAGYRLAGASRTAHRLLRDPQVAAAVDAGKRARSKRAGIDADWVLNRLVAEAEADIADLYDGNGDLRPIADWPLVWRQGLIVGFDIDAIYEGRGEGRTLTGYAKKIKLSERLRRLELIGKHVRVNAFQEVVKLKGLATLAERLERAHRRAAAQEE